MNKSILKRVALGGANQKLIEKAARGLGFSPDEARSLAADRPEDVALWCSLGEVPPEELSREENVFIAGPEEIVVKELPVKTPQNLPAKPAVEGVEDPVVKEVIVINSEPIVSEPRKRFIESSPSLRKSRLKGG